MGNWQGTMEIMDLKPSLFWNNKRVLITGHTGFKGSWLILMLLHYGAKVCGYSTNRGENNTIFDLIKHLQEKCFMLSEILETVIP